MNNSEAVKNRILWKVYVVWFFRRIVPLILLQVLFFALAIQIFAKNVFVSRVLQNIGTVAENGYVPVLKYLAVSFLGTRPLTQVSILIILGVLALILRDLGRSLVAYKSMWMRKE
ncbi:MAG: hypothetical protein HZB99_01150 [Candidatus Harrisonbacteria bacterium]|nr:hypothetical protein [Candidatus Harrisonbacteria bacterium]